jgi:hypothetical protein
LEGFCSTIELHPPGTFENSLPHHSENPHCFIHCCCHHYRYDIFQARPKILVEGEGFEPSKAEPTDLQSAPFDRSGTPPNEADNYGEIPY